MARVESLPMERLTIVVDVVGRPMSGKTELLTLALEALEGVLGAKNVVMHNNGVGNDITARRTLDKKRPNIGLADLGVLANVHWSRPRSHGS